jgi:hypothetical protein
VWKSKFYGVFLHAIDATLARWRGDAGSSPLDGHPTHWLDSTQAPTGYRVSKGTGNQDYGEYTKHDYLKRLSDLLAEHGRKSGADLKMLLDPSMKSLMERRNKEGV